MVCAGTADQQAAGSDARDHSIERCAVNNLDTMRYTMFSGRRMADAACLNESTARNHKEKNNYKELLLTRMWANAQPDGRPAEQAAPSVQRRNVWLTPTTRCRAVTLPIRKTR